MNEAELLLLIRGPLFQFALSVFLIGVVVRLFEILLLRRKPEYAEARGSAFYGGVHTIFSRFVPDHDTWQRSTMVVLAGYLFHGGLFLVIFLYTQHILVFQEILGFSWPALPTQVVDAAALVSILAMVILLLYRILQPVRRFLSRPEDYLVWIVTMLPLLTGYMATHSIGLTPQTLIILHILSVEILLMVLPFTNLMHTFTVFVARYYTGATAGYRGIKA